MAKRPLYAAAEAAASVAAAAAVLAVQVAAASGGQAGACATCVAVAVTIEAVGALPVDLGGLEVFVRIPAEQASSAAATLADIERKGGRPSIIVDGGPSVPDRAAVTRARRILMEAPARGPAESEEQFAFALKIALTTLRAAAAETASVGLIADAPNVSALVANDLASYVDFLVVRGKIAAPPQGIEMWRLVEDDGISLDRVLALTRGGGATRWLWVLPADPALAAAKTAELERAAAVPVPEAVSAGAETQFGQQVDVVGSRALTVEEIVARHQAAAARQKTLLRTVIAGGSLTLSFEAPGFPAPVTISSRVTLYTSPDTTEIEQQDIRVNGVAFRGSAVPRLPIIEPERVASPPLAIALTDVYRYRLDGHDRIGGTPCYVVSFEPDPARPDRHAPLFRGRAWIAADSFAMLRVSAAQTGLRGAIVASEQIDSFHEVQPGIWLLAESDVRQMYEGAAHRTPIHRVLAIEADEVNPKDFTERRRRAYMSASVMLRDTPEGFRYLKKGDNPAGERPATASTADRVRTIAAGVIIDPNISVPLPFAGLSYVDFNFLRTGTQLNAFFGGTYGQFAFSIPSLGGSRWQLAGRGFGIATSYNDRSFVHGQERYEEDIRQRPAQLSLWLLRPLSPRVSIHVGYDLDYTQLAAGDQTAADFLVPPDQVVHGARLSLDAQRSGWNASVWWNPARRSGWHAWGRSGTSDYRASQRDFQRYGLTIARAHVINPRLVGRVEGAWMDGRDLDRFSRYSFGTFDNRLRGYPSALIRYDRGAVLRTAIAWGAGRLLRVDGFVDAAEVHDPGFGAGLRNYTGVGGAVEVPVPFGTLLAIEWGYGFRGVNSNGTLGTQVLRISGYKVF